MESERKNIGKIVSVIMDRPMGSYHPTNGTFYPINYGYVEGLIGGDGEEQDVYILGADKPMKYAKVKIIAVIVRSDDNETKWVGVPINCKKTFNKNEIMNQVHFMEKWFKTDIIM